MIHWFAKRFHSESFMLGLLCCHEARNADASLRRPTAIPGRSPRIAPVTHPYLPFLGQAATNQQPTNHQHENPCNGSQLDDA